MAFNFKKFLKLLIGTGVGAAGGVAAGSAGGPIGMTLGGLSGAATGMFAAYNSGGRKGRHEQVPTKSPQQIEAQNRLLQEGLSDTDMKGLENLYKKQFQEETIPSIAERFSNIGTGGQRSSSFINALTSSGEGLNAQLAALRSQSGFSKLQLGLGDQFETQYTKGTPDSFESTILPLMQLLSMSGGFQGLGGKGAGKGKKGTPTGRFEPLYYGGQPQGYSVGQQSPAFKTTFMGKGF